jgi:hypothetical protein
MSAFERFFPVIHVLVSGSLYVSVAILKTGSI